MKAGSTLYAFLNKDFVPLQEASLHVSDLAIQRGYGVFDFIKVQNRQPLFLQDYLVRFYNSASELNLAVPYSLQELKAIILELVQKNDLEVSGLKIILTGGYADNGYDPVKPNLLMLQQPLVLPGKEMLEKGIKIITHEYIRELPHVKTINYTMGIRLQKTIRENEAAEVLYQKDGLVTEFPRCNFFILKKDDTIATPAKNILHGITRKNVLELAGKKYKVEEGDITVEDIRQAKEAFLTSTTKRILPIVQIDEQIIGEGKPGNVTIELLQELINLENQTLSANAHE